MLDNILNSLIPKEDKLKHFYIGSFVLFICLCFFSMWWSFLIVSLVAITKEIFDYISKKGTPEFLDFLFTILPSILYLLINIIKQYGIS